MPGPLTTTPRVACVRSPAVSPLPPVRRATLQRRTIKALAGELHCSTVVFEGADHFGPLQQPQQFADAVSRHLLTG